MIFNPIDIILGLLILILGLKGALNGFRRELFAFFGLIGGVFVASRTAAPLAELTKERFGDLANPAVLRLTAFVLVLTLIWGGISMIGRLVDRKSDRTSPGGLSRFFGFLIASIKYFLIFAMILSAFYRTPTIRKRLHKHTESSLLFPYLEQAGSTLLHFAPPAPRIPPGGQKTSPAL